MYKKSKYISKYILTTLTLSIIIFNLCLYYFPTVEAQTIADKKPIYFVDNDNMQISLTFDAAWGSEKTQKILDVLDENDIKCTFFLVSFWAEENPELVRQMVEKGHEIGTHSSTHPHFNSLSDKEKEEELRGSIERIERISNTKITSFRAPFGEYNNDLLTLTERMNLDTIQWDVDSLDWKKLSSQEIYQRITSKVKSGSIILCHNDGQNTVDAIKKVIPYLKEQGYVFKPVNQIVYPRPYTVDNNGAQKPSTTYNTSEVQNDIRRKQQCLC